MTTFDLDTVEVDEPLRLVKLAEVRGRSAATVHPIGSFRRHPYPHRERAEATCHRSDHAAPALGCGCGFHAVSRLEDLPAVTGIPADAVALSVDFDGTIVEHEHGFRASHQTVVGISFSDRCAWCGGEASRLVPGRRWRSACARCAGRRWHRGVNRAEAIARLGVDVGFAPLPRPPRFSRALGVARCVSLTMVAAGVLAAAVILGLGPVQVVSAGVGAGLCVSATAASCRVRSTRWQSGLLLSQAAVLVASSIVLVTGSA